MALEASAVATAIAALTVSGVNTIRDLDGVGVAYSDRDCPLVCPAVDKYLTLEDATQLTFGPDGLWQYTYTLAYRFIQAPVGSDRSLRHTMPNTVSGYAAFIKAVAQARHQLGVASVAAMNLKLALLT